MTDNDRDNSDTPQRWLSTPPVRRYTKKQYRELSARWYKRLKDSGFKDIERTTARGEVKAKEAVPSTLVKRYPHVGQATLDFYSMCSEFLWEHRWEGERARFMWSLFCEGQSIRRIVVALRLRYRGRYASCRLNKDDVNRFLLETMEKVRDWRATRLEEEAEEGEERP